MVIRKFSLIELLIVVAILAMLMSLLSPSFQRTLEASRRVKCSQNLRSMAIGATTFSNDKNGAYPKCRQESVQIAFNISQFDELNEIGWGSNQKMSDIWNCPSRNFQTNTNDIFGQIIIGYQYFGGISRWRNFMGRFTSFSPRYQNTAQPGWALAADTTSKIDGEWGGGRATAYQDMPSHKIPNTSLPAGSNQVYADGSTEWVDFFDLLYLHSWSTKGRKFYFYQEDIGNIVPDERIIAKYED